jgi:uncharacterized RDD family membrane protein YckC
MNLLSKGNKMKTAFSVFAIAVLAVMLIGVLIAFPVMLLWNYCLVGAVAGVSEITFLQAWGLYILSNLMFKTSVSNKKD